MLPLRVDLFYRERLWRPPAIGRRPSRSPSNGQSHFFLLTDRGVFDLPAGQVPDRGLIAGCPTRPREVEFALRAGERRQV